MAKPRGRKREDPVDPVEGTHSTESSSLERLWNMKRKKGRLMVSDEFGKIVSIYLTK